MALYDISRLYAHKKSTTCVLLGSGTSINRISGKEWEWISSCDSYAMNNWVYHPFFVPNFYFIEAKKYNYKILERRFKEKKHQYKKTKFIFPRQKVITFEDETCTFLRDVVGHGVDKFEYDIIAARDPKRFQEKFNADYNPSPYGLTKSYDMSITLLFEVLYKMNYNLIITWGIDLQNSEYFWGSGDPMYGEVHHLWNKQHEDRDPQEPHATHRIKDFIVDANRKWFKPAKTAFYVGHTDTDLYPEIPCIYPQEEELL